jgi:hypothetical protein
MSVVAKKGSEPHAPPLTVCQGGAATLLGSQDFILMKDDRERTGEIQARPGSEKS